MHAPQHCSGCRNIRAVQPGYLLSHTSSHLSAVKLMFTYLLTNIMSPSPMLRNRRHPPGRLPCAAAETSHSCTLDSGSTDVLAHSPLCTCIVRASVEAGGISVAAQRAGMQPAAHPHRSSSHPHAATFAPSLHSALQLHHRNSHPHCSQLDTLNTSAQCHLNTLATSFARSPGSPRWPCPPPCCRAPEHCWTRPPPPGERSCATVAQQHGKQAL